MERHRGLPTPGGISAQKYMLGHGKGAQGTLGRSKKGGSTQESGGTKKRTRLCEGKK